MELRFYESYDQPQISAEKGPYNWISEIGFLLQSQAVYLATKAQKYVTTWTPYTNRKKTAWQNMPTYQPTVHKI